jgi:hypothetical protein
MMNMMAQMVNMKEQQKDLLLGLIAPLEIQQMRQPSQTH